MAGPKQLDFVGVVVDEIALEGLDGITIEALWLRLSQRTSFTLPLDDFSKTFIWNIILTHSKIQFYELPEPRKPLTIFDRYDFVDPDIGTVLEPPERPYDLYPFYLVNDVRCKVKGSCSQYYSRRDITPVLKKEKPTLANAILKWGQSLVLVASQAVREVALTACSIDPTVEISPMRYCILERVGRLRTMGEATQGKTGLQELESEPKSLFYHRKFLSTHSLVTKQVHHQKSGVQNVMGLLLHLPRFYVERQSKTYMLTQRVVEILKSHPNCIADYEEIRKALGVRGALKKLFKTPDFRRYVKVDLRVPYRTLYPEAKMREWKRKSGDAEKSLRAVQLLDPGLSLTPAAKDDDEGVEQDPDTAQHVYTPSHVLHDRSLLHQAFYQVDAAGPNGVSQMELSRMIGVTKLQSRTLCRNLLRKDVVATIMNDIGRQRVTRYMSKRFLTESKLAIQFKEEKEKMLSLISKTCPPTKKKKKKKKVVVDSVTEASVDIEATSVKNEKSVKRKATSSAAGGASKKLKPGLTKKASDVSVTSQMTDDSTSQSSADFAPQTDGDFSHLSEVGATPAVVVPHSMFDTNIPSKLESESLMEVDEAPESKAEATVLSEVDVKLEVYRADMDEDLEVQQAGVAQLNSVETEISEVVDGAFGNSDNVIGFLEELGMSYPRHTKDSPGVTYRLLKRANLIIEAVQTHKVIDDLTKLIKLISETEDKEGYYTKIDKKSLMRLLVKLNKDKNVKFLRIKLTAGEKIKVLNFVCDPNISDDHAMIQSAIEQEKLKFFIPPRAKMLKPEASKAKAEDKQDAFSEQQVVQSINELKEITVKDTEIKLIQDRTAGKRYGFCPKFIRLRTVHQLLFYVIYGYKGVEDLDQNEVVKEMQDGGVVLSNTDIAELPTMYHSQLDWKMFIPPLQPLPGWPSGWAIVCDILLRIPLSIFVKIFNVSYQVEDLQEYLHHPTRRHFLLKSLPLAMRSNLMAGRKYIFSFHELLQRLCFVGLAQFGPQRLKEKDQVFFFLNRCSNLLDTMNSRPGYHQISEDLDYARHDHRFETAEDVDKYWYEMWNVCLQTPLGGRLCMTGKDIVLEILQNKQVMIEALAVRAPHEAPEKDTGFVPGDRRGAAGLDSALFSHLKRNWNWTNAPAQIKVVSSAMGSAVEVSPVENLRRARLESLTPASHAYRSGKQGSSRNKSPAPAVASTSRIQDVVLMQPEGLSIPIPMMQPSRSKAMAYTRTVKPRRNKKVVRLWYDDIDHKTEESMTRRRAKWSDQEDNLLLLCKVGMIFLCPNPRKQIINFQAIRDICHSAMPSTRNKTSRACQRRINVMMKNKTTVKNVSLHLEEVKHDDFIVKHFARTMADVKGRVESLQDQENLVTDKYKLLLQILRKKFNRTLLCAGDAIGSVDRSILIIPDQPQQLLADYDVLLPPDSMKIKGEFPETRNVVDILCATVTTIVHSTLCSLPDKTSYMYQLFKIYQQYPDNLLRSVMTKLRNDRMVSLRKTYVQMLHKTGNYLPVSSLPYQLSITYFYLLQTKYDYDVFGQCGAMRKKLQTHTKQAMDCVDLDGGSTACLVELFVQDKISLVLSIPENIVILDPNLNENHEAYVKIITTYQNIVRNCKQAREVPLTSPLFNKPCFVTPVEEEAGSSGATVIDIPDTRSCQFNVKAIGKYALPQKGDEDWSESDEFSVDEEEKEGEGVEGAVGTPLSRSTQISIARAASRIALFSMRDDFLFSKSATASGDNVQHAHDFLVVNSCKVACQLREPCDSSPFVFRGRGIHPARDKMEEAVSTAGAGDVNTAFQHESLEMKAKCNETLGKIKRCVVVPDSPVSPDDAHNVFITAGASESDWQHACRIVSYVQSKKEVGATVKELRDTFSSGCCDRPLGELLQLLTATRYVSRVGVTTYHYVHQLYLKPWLLHSYKIKRLAREKLPPPVNLAGTLVKTRLKRSAAAEDRRRLTKIKRDAQNMIWSDDMVVGESGEEEGSSGMQGGFSDKLFGDHAAVAVSVGTEDAASIVPESAASAVSAGAQVAVSAGAEGAVTEDAVSAGAEGAGASISKEPVLTQDKLDESVVTPDVAEEKLLETPLGEYTLDMAVCDVDKSDTEMVDVMIRPWVRVDGTLNRRVLDRMLGSVLSECMLYPGMCVKKIQERFAPALQPVHTREILEILEKIDCVSLQAVIRSAKPSVFSKPSTVSIIERVDGTQDEAMLAVKVAVDAITRLSIFIGDKAYRKDFLGS